MSPQTTRKIKALAQTVFEARTAYDKIWLEQFTQFADEFGFGDPKGAAVDMMLIVDQYIVSGSSSPEEWEKHITDYLDELEREWFGPDLPKERRPKAGLKGLRCRP